MSNSISYAMLPSAVREHLASLPAQDQAQSYARYKGIHYGNNTTNTQHGDIVLGDKIVNNFFSATPPPDSRQLLIHYLESVLRRCDQIPFTTITSLSYPGTMLPGLADSG